MNAAAAKSLHLCPTLCDPRDGSQPGSPIPGILQARTLEWVAISFSSAWKWKVKVKLLSCVQLLVTPWIAGHQAPPSMGFPRQEYWSGVPLPSPRYIPKYFILFVAMMNGIVSLISLSIFSLLILLVFRRILLSILSACVCHTRVSVRYYFRYCEIWKQRWNNFPTSRICCSVA